MFFKLVLIILLIPGHFMRVTPHEKESGQDTISQNRAKKPVHTTFLGKFIPNNLLNPHISTIDYDHEYLEKNAVPFVALKGKIIRHIYINSIDPFGYSLVDTTVRPISFTQKTGNFLHIITKEKVIRNQLLIQPLQPFDSLLFKESERLIRMQKYVQDVVTYTAMDSPKADSVDIYFRVIDIWSIIPTLRQTGQNDEAGLADNNFLGSGNRLQLDTRFGKNINGIVTQWGYTISNISNSHITGSFLYYFQGNNDLVNNPDIRKPAYSSLSYNLPTLSLSNRYLVRSFELYRPFVSPVTRWAGGIFMGQLITRQNYIEKDSLRYLSSKTTIRDLWGAVSLPLLPFHSKNAGTSSIILSARVLKTRYPRPIFASQATGLFHNENFYFAGIGITSRRYIQDRYVFNYGKIEDIPVGRSFGITTGIYSQKYNQFYVGLKASFGDNYPFGYFSTHLEYGTFISSSRFSQQVITARANYFTRLFSAGYWRIRQFIQPSLILGKNRLPTDNLTPGDLLEGVETLRIPATRLIALTLQTQSYSPWEIYGFRFGPYFFSTVGTLSYAGNISKNHFYSALGLGVLIKNNYLLINTFQVSFTFYPYLPTQVNPVLVINAYKTSDYGLSDFEISKPQVVEYK